MIKRYFISISDDNNTFYFRDEPYGFAPEDQWVTHKDAATRYDYRTIADNAFPYIVSMYPGYTVSLIEEIVVNGEVAHAQLI